MDLLSPNRETCVKCRNCIEICPMHVIAQDEEGYPAPIHDCVDVCVPGALSHRVRRRSNNPDAALRRLKRIKENRKKRG